MLFNGDGYQYPAEIILASKKQAVITTAKPEAKEPPPSLNIQLGIALSKGDRFDFALQKATELGVSSITPLLTEHTAVKLNADRLKKKHAHWQGIITSACEQSGRCYLPRLDDVTTIENYLAQQSQGLKFILDPNASSPMKQFSPLPDNAVMLMIGPEGGFSAGEIDQAEQQQFYPVRLGQHVLRTETAPIAAIAAAQSLWGDFQ